MQTRQNPPPWDLVGGGWGLSSRKEDFGGESLREKKKEDNESFKKRQRMKNKNEKKA